MRVLILLALLGTAFAVPKTVNRIVGGEQTTVQNYPYISNMQHNFYTIWWIQECGGSLLSNTIVLSAAHCYEDDPPAKWRVALGTSSVSIGGTLHLVSQIVTHEDYNIRPKDADIALIRLAVPATFSSVIQVARIPGVNFIVPDGDTVTAIGWGSLSSGGAYPEELRHVDTNIINQELCASRYAWLKTQPSYRDWPDVTDGMLCAGILNIGGKGTCLGDNGGPLAYQGDIIVGVTSWGFGCGNSDFPGVNTRVSYYSNWIIQTANSI